MVKKHSLLSALLVLSIAFVAIGCSGGGSDADKALETAAPAPSSKGVAEQPMEKPNRPGGMGASGAGAAPSTAGTGEIVK